MSDNGFNIANFNAGGVYMGRFNFASSLKYTCLPAVLASGLTGRNFPQPRRNEAYIKRH